KLDARTLNPAILGLEQQFPLSHGKIRFSVNSAEIFALFKEDVAMRLLQLGQRDPFLSQWPHILAFIFTNGTVPRRLIWVWILCSARNADVAHKLATPPCLQRSEPFVGSPVCRHELPRCPRRTD